VPNSLKSLITSAYIEGRYSYATFRKAPAITTAAGMWVDLSMASGNPVPNYYVGAELTATVPNTVAGVSTWYKKGIWDGGPVSPAKKLLHKVCMLCTNAVGAPAPYLLCDYLMYYPLIDMDNTDTQLFVNYGSTETDTTSPTANYIQRYTSGMGVQAFLVATNPYIGGQAFRITYTNSAGVPDRVSQRTVTNTATYIGTILNSNTAGVNNFGCFINLQAGDTGIRSVQSIAFEAANGGLATLVLVKPIATLMTREATAWAEFDFIKDKPSMPVILDGAYLNLLVMPSGSLAAVPVIGEITTIWASQA